MAPRRANAHWTIPADLTRVAPLVIEAADLLELHGLSGKPLFAAQLVLEETVTNAVRHACGEDASRLVEVRLDLDDNGIWLTVVDDGLPFNPICEAPEPDFDKPLAEKQPGGLGVYLVKAKVDDWDYQRAGPTNRLRLRVVA